jgi:threonine/homoserine/homoserine lactone efflux protein
LRGPGPESQADNRVASLTAVWVGDIGAGAVLGLGAGLSPGPLLGLTLTSTLQGGLAAGARTAMAPLITDLPIVAIALILVTSVPHGFAGGLALCGGGVVVWFGIEAMRSARHATLPTPDLEAAVTRSALRRAAAVNIVSPHPWLFWLTVGATQLTSTSRRSGVAVAVLFLVAFYAMLVGAKLSVAVAANAGRSRLSLTGYRRLLAGSGVLLLVTGVILAAEAF